MVRLLRWRHGHRKPEQGASAMSHLAVEANTAFYSAGGDDGPHTEDEHAGCAFDRPSDADKSTESRLGHDCSCRHGPHSDMELIKEKFAKLLLGEDMSGGGKGVSSAVALSNAITNLAASVFSEQRRLVPMPAETKARWRKEIDWLLSVADYIVELVPSQQTSKDGSNMEIMVTQQRRDLQINIPALRKLDALLLGYLDNFKDHSEFWYISEDADESEKRTDDKWWLPTVKVPPDGLSEVTRKWLQFQKESVHQVLKAAMAINAQILTEMEVPDAYIESLPKNGRSSLGDAIYRSITDDDFIPDLFLQSMDLSTEHKILDLKNRIEASTVIWKRKMHKESKSSWGSAVSMERREEFEERAEIVLHLIKQRFPGIPQSSLDMCKIQYNKDVGQSILESYSRVLESLAFTVMSLIEDVLHADSLAREPSNEESRREKSLPDIEVGSAKKLDPIEEMEKLVDSPDSMTLSDFMGWHFDPDAESEFKNSEDAKSKDEMTKKPPNVDTGKKFSYIEKLENLKGSRTPTSRD